MKAEYIIELPLLLEHINWCLEKWNNGLLRFLIPYPTERTAVQGENGRTSECSTLAVAQSKCRYMGNWYRIVTFYYLGGFFLGGGCFSF